jgi:hypothetical protein
MEATKAAARSLASLASKPVMIASPPPLGSLFLGGIVDVNGDFVVLCGWDAGERVVELGEEMFVGNDDL